MTEPELPVPPLPAAFSDPDSARRSLDRLREAAGAESDAHLEQLARQIALTADPDGALLRLERLILEEATPTEALSEGAAADLAAPGDGTGANRAAARLKRICANPRGLETLTTLFAGSEFLSKIVLRQPRTLDALLELPRLTQAFTPEELSERLDRSLEREAALLDSDFEPLLTLRRFQRRHLLRIGTCDLLGLLDLPTITQQISLLADLLVDRALELVWRDEDPPLSDFTVLAFGKLGGRELNYSSDIDLVFCCRQNAPQFWSLARRLIEGLSRTTPEGFLYRVDMRLRPWGRDGALVNSVDSQLSYLRRHAKSSERQSYLKARAIAGDVELGRDLLERVRPLLFETPPGEVRLEVRELKKRIEGQLNRQEREWGHIKSGIGSIRDVEFATQALQLIGDGSSSILGEGGTLAALAALLEEGTLSASDYRTLVSGYVFLRTIEHYLQLQHNLQIHVLPIDPQALDSLARRLGFSGDQATAHFLERYDQHRHAVREVYLRLVGSTDEAAAEEPETRQALSAMPEAYRDLFAAEELAGHGDMVERLSPENLVEIDAVSVDADDDSLWRVTVVGYDFVGELSLICGLLFAHGFNIVDGHVFSSESTGVHPPTPMAERGRPRPSSPLLEPEALAERGLIVDVFTVRHPDPQSTSDTGGARLWAAFEQDLEELLLQLVTEGRHSAQTELVKRIALELSSGRKTHPQAKALPPISIHFDNQVSSNSTVLEIRAPDTVGFLYEFTNALALHDISVQHMTVDSQGDQVCNLLFVTDLRGQKILSEDKLQRLRVATVLTKHFTHLLPYSPNPVSALLHFRDFLGDLFRRDEWALTLDHLERPEVLANLARLMGVSDFLWQDFLRLQHENLFPILRGGEELTPRPATDLSRELRSELDSCRDLATARTVVNSFKDREMFRIDMRQILDRADFDTFSRELSELTDVVFSELMDFLWSALVKEHGVPRDSKGATVDCALLALGKWGGRELGYASDVELVLVYGGEGECDGPKKLSAAEFFDRVVEELNRAIETRHEGIFEVDLRLRPYGAGGPLAVSRSAFERYFAPEGDAWPHERQGLVKLRATAGKSELRSALEELRDRLVYRPDTNDPGSVLAMRERQVRHLVTPGTINAKFSPGALTDLEYLVQLLQLEHGADHPSVRTTNTLEAIAALGAEGLVTGEQASLLEQGYRFFRHLINGLRMVRGNARDLTIPEHGSDELRYLARRLGIGDERTLLDTLEERLGATADLWRGLTGSFLGA